MTQDSSSKSKSPANSAGLSFDDDNIFALASGRLPCAVAIVRISGRSCLERLKSVIRLSANRWLEYRQLHLCIIVDSESGTEIDKPLVSLFQGPKSFTGEDAAEIHIHGSPIIWTKLAASLRKVGFRDALPGEFSRRAFLNEKFDLAQAEGLHLLIQSETETQFRCAQSLLGGSLSKLAITLRQQLIEALAIIELKIDFPDEEESVHQNMQAAFDKVVQVQDTLQNLSSTYRAGTIAQDGFKVALIGPPNAGKSTLLNKLLGHERSIVSDIPGTTRDYIQESVILNGRLIRLIDTAGIRSASDQIEQQGIIRSLEVTDNADLVIVLVAANDSMDKSTKDLLDRAPHDRRLLVRTKCDLTDKAKGDLQLSALTGDGIANLIEVICEKFDKQTAGISEQAFISSERQASAIADAVRFLDHFSREYSNHAFAEILGFEVQNAIRSVESIVGRVDADDVLGQIFSQFCIGK
jgi:tRNA modification GTPase